MDLTLGTLALRTPSLSCCDTMLLAGDDKSLQFPDKGTEAPKILNFFPKVARQLGKEAELNS